MDATAAPSDDGPAPVKIALLLPNEASLRTLRRAAELAAGLAETRTASGETIEVTVGLAEPDEERWRRGERLLRTRAPGTVVRHLAWTAVPVDNARRMFTDLDPALDLDGLDTVIVPRDWGWNFQDCALWICFADPAIGAVLPLRPTVYYSLGLPERYAPQIVAGSIHDAYWTRQVEAFRMWRQAIVVTSDPTALPDLVSYAGVRSERTELIPDVMEDLPLLASDAARDPLALVWLPRGDAGDDLHAALAGYQIYCREGGTLSLILAEEERADRAEHPSAATLPLDLRTLYDDVTRIAYRSLEELDRLLVRSTALWSSQVAGGGGEHLLEAERAGLRVMAASFPLTRSLSERRGLDAVLYAPGEALGIADALARLERLGAGRAQTSAPAEAQTSASAEAATSAQTRSASDRTTTQSAAFGFLFDWLLATARAR